MENYITLIRFTYPEDAFIIKGRLEAEGIVCFLKDELRVEINKFYPNAIGAIKLEIKRRDCQRAMEILQKGAYFDAPESYGNTISELLDRFTSSIPLIRFFPVAVRILILVMCIILVGLGIIWLLVVKWGLEIYV